ncbi:integrase [Mycobacterium phage Phrappuccino]|uniref:Integrase n=1 Tax=Mycobacterium phage Phrappuccino TaxID=2591223 RepID=A0A514DDM8_9CAUD|nr:integrase [Mycobacterium phage Phrappuccino]QDH91716.1 integrase [Mycobacterium phage Phrappuccino]QIQ63159.1 tyrosine homologous recombinase [Mycobacterium phage Settecandela]
MAFVRTRYRKDGSPYFSVVFKLSDGTETSDSYNDLPSAEKTKMLVDAVGGDKALEILGIPHPSERRKGARGAGPTVAEWVEHYIDHLTGIDKGTITKYRAYLKNDITPILGEIPLTELSRDHLSRWVQWMEKEGALNRDGSRRPAKPKTIANKHGFLSGVLDAAVPKHIPANPAEDRRLPKDTARDADEEMVFLTRNEFARLLDSVTEYWRPLVEFLVASGCRWGEASALRPEDVNRTEGTVRIRRAWTYSPGGEKYRLVKTKGKSKRTINVPRSVLTKLNYNHEWVFVNRAGGPVRNHGFHRRVWVPAVKKADLDVSPRIHDLRHTCASWLISAGVPLPVIQRHLGHQSIKTTIDVYGHLDRTSFAVAADVIEGVLGA